VVAIRQRLGKTPRFKPTNLDMAIDSLRVLLSRFSITQVINRPFFNLDEI
jgi:hypothetical protein